jgi:hypothetical protein
MRQPTGDMTTKTVAESVFEEFCYSNDIAYEKITEGPEPTPDYKLMLNSVPIVVEVKQIDNDEDFNFKGGHSTRTLGSHIRNKIHDVRTRGQLKSASTDGIATILLVYNNLDPSQMFGTDPQDFIWALYGELTEVLNPKDLKIEDSFHGRNSSFRKNKNTSISAVGYLCKTESGPRVHLHENIFAKNPLKFSMLPGCFEFTRIVLE